jgi:DNA-binding NtrC family response regulator
LHGHHAPGSHDGLNVVVADEDPVIVGSIMRALRSVGFRAFHAYDGRAAVELALALRHIHLLISNTRISDYPGVELIRQLVAERPGLPVIYIANTGRSTPEIEARLPRSVPILREPFTDDELLALVRRTLPGHEEGRKRGPDGTGADGRGPA